MTLSAQVIGELWRLAPLKLKPLRLPNHIEACFKDGRAGYEEDSEDGSEAGDDWSVFRIAFQEEASVDCTHTGGQTQNLSAGVDYTLRVYCQIEVYTCNVD